MKTNQKSGPTQIQNPLNFVVRISSEKAGVPNFAVKNPPRGGVPNLINNYIQLQILFAKVGLRLNAVRTLHFARVNFADKKRLKGNDRLRIRKRYREYFPAEDINAQGDLTAFYQTATLLTSYDGEFDNYVSSFALTSGAQFNALFGFLEGGSKIVPVQKNISAFVRYLSDHNLPSTSFASMYPLISVVQVIQNAKKNGVAYIPPTEPKNGLIRHTPEVPDEAPEEEPTLDLADIQGLIIRGYRVHYCRHFVCEIADLEATRKLIGELVGGDPQDLKITTAELPGPKGPRPDYFLNISFTYQGLENMRIDTGQKLAEAFESFPSFVEGAAARADFVGDTGASAPKHWKAGLGTPSAQVVLSLYARGVKPNVAGKVLEEKTKALKAKMKKALKVVDTLDGNTLPDGRIHFGYKDGIAQPTIAAKNAPERPSDGNQPKMPVYDVVLTGENNRRRDPSPYKIPKKIGRNGSFGALRVLKQDVHRFNKYLKEESDKLNPEVNSEDYLAAKFCGRWRDGQPLTLVPTAKSPRVDDAQLNNFTYNSAATEPPAHPDDFEGARCPIGSHIRRANPRDMVVASPVEHHRIIRRAMPYGPVLNPGDPKDNDKERGLIGFFIGASLRHSFEFIMHTWVNDSLFAPDLPYESGDGVPIVGSMDPLLGANKAKSSVFNILEKDENGAGEVRSVGNFPRFVTTRGGAYCFFPGIKALKYMARGKKRKAKRAGKKA